MASTESSIGKAKVATKKKLSSKSFGSVSNYAFVIPGVVFLLVFMVYPILYNLIISFQDVTIMNLTGEHNFVGLSNYQTIFSDPTFFKSLSNSVIFTALCIIFQFIIGLGLALFFNQNFPGRNLFRSLMLIGWMMPMIITGTLFSWMMSGDHGIINYFLMQMNIIDEPMYWLTERDSALYGTIIANIWVGIPFNMIILLSALQALPGQLYEAAKIDGANRFRQFLHITLPLLKPTILILVMLGIIYTFKVFDLILIMTGGGPANATTVLPYYAYELAFENFEFSLGATVATIMLVLLLFLSFIYLWMMRKEEKIS